MMYKRLAVMIGAMLVTAAAALAAEPAATQPAAAVAQEPQGGYEVHDKRRPQPPVVTPGSFSTQDKPGAAPSDAIVLFDGKDLSNWKAKRGGGEAQWTVENGELVVARGGSIVTRGEFGDAQLHVEWMQPKGTGGRSQGRGNSGVFLMGLYEVQVLDSHNSETYADGMAGSLYGQYPPLANATRPQGEWQVYDIVFRAPRYEDGRVAEPATMTVFLNGVLVQDHSKLLGASTHQAMAKYPAEHPKQGPIELQDHGNPVRFRNIWLRELPARELLPKPPTKGAGENYYEKK